MLVPDPRRARASAAAPLGFPSAVGFFALSTLLALLFGTCTCPQLPERKPRGRSKRAMLSRHAMHHKNTTAAERKQSLEQATERQKLLQEREAVSEPFGLRAVVAERSRSDRRRIKQRRDRFRTVGKRGAAKAEAAMWSNIRIHLAWKATHAFCFLHFLGRPGVPQATHSPHEVESFESYDVVTSGMRHTGQHVHASVRQARQGQATRGYRRRQTREGSLGYQEAKCWKDRKSVV